MMIKPMFKFAKYTVIAGAVTIGLLYTKDVYLKHKDQGKDSTSAAAATAGDVTEKLGDITKTTFEYTGKGIEYGIRSGKQLYDLMKEEEKVKSIPHTPQEKAKSKAPAELEQKLD